MPSLRHAGHSRRPQQNIPFPMEPCDHPANTPRMFFITQLASSFTTISNYWGCGQRSSSTPVAPNRCQQIVIPPCGVALAGHHQHHDQERNSMRHQTSGNKSFFPLAVSHLLAIIGTTTKRGIQ